MIDYFFYTIVSLGCSFLVYFFILKDEKTFQFNRFYLLISLLLCLLAPLFKITTIKPVPSITEISLQSSEEKQIIELETSDAIIVDTQPSRFTLTQMLWYLYIVVSILLLIRFTRNLLNIIQLTQQQHTRFENVKLVKISGHESMSSFFNYVFINSESLTTHKSFRSMIKHELVHCKQKHTLDVIFMELLLCFFWFNPFVWLYRRVIIQNHEFIADHLTVSTGINLNIYSQSIIESGNQEHRVPLTSGFNFIQIKNRIIMLHQSKSSLSKRIFKMASVALIFTCIFIFSCTYEDISKDPLTVVIDAGHGGHDSGESSNGDHEKQIVLQISNVLASLSDAHIEIIQTRSNDEFLTLKERAEFINTKKPDLFLSLHCNSSNNKQVSGVEAYCDKSQEEDSTYVEYSKILLKNQTEHFLNRGVKFGNMYLLKNTTVPGVFLELGFLTNENDKRKLLDKEKQTQIAKSIYDGLLEIKQNR